MKYKLLTPREAEIESNKGTPLFFGDGPPEYQYIDGQATLLAVDHCDGIAFLVEWPTGEKEWLCNCWKEA